MKQIQSAKPAQKVTGVVFCNVGTVLERLGATEQRNLKPSEQVVQLCLIMRPKFVYDLALLVLRNGILLAMTELEEPPLPFELL